MFIDVCSFCSAAWLFHNHCWERFSESAVFPNRPAEDWEQHRFSVQSESSPFWGGGGGRICSWGSGLWNGGEGRRAFLRLHVFIAHRFDSFAPQVLLEQQVELPFSHLATQINTSFIYWLICSFLFFIFALKLWIVTAWDSVRSTPVCNL